MIKILLALALVVVPAAAQIPLVSLLNATRPGSAFQIGDRFEIVITAAPNQPISVRTSRQGRTDWSPVVGSTDSTGRWSTGGQFEKRDFGGWRESWTVGGKLASPVIQFSVNAPCLPGGKQFLHMSGPNMHLNCETSDGTQSFATPSLSDSFRTPDGRPVNGSPAGQTPEQYHTELLQYFIENGMGPTPAALHSSRGGLGDETAGLISKLIGPNALTETETRNALAILGAAFEKPETIQPPARQPSSTLLLLHHLSALTAPGDLKREIEESIAYFEAR